MQVQIASETAAPTESNGKWILKNIAAERTQAVFNPITRFMNGISQARNKISSAIGERMQIYATPRTMASVPCGIPEIPCSNQGLLSCHDINPNAGSSIVIVMINANEIRSRRIASSAKETPTLA